VWWTKHRDASVKVSELWAMVNSGAALMELGDGSDQSQKIRLGKMLSSLRDRSFSLEIESESRRITVSRGEKYQGAYTWKLVDGESASGGIS
jgi:hypothetical protein